MIFILSITIPLTLNPTLCFFWWIRFFCCEVFYSVSVADARYLEQRPVFECGVTEHVFLLAFILKDITWHLRMKRQEWASQQNGRKTQKKTSCSPTIIQPYGCFQKCGYPKWMVYNGKPYYQWMIWGGKPTIFGNIHINPGEPWGHRFRERSFDCVGLQLSFGSQKFIKNTGACKDHASDVSGLPGCPGTGFLRMNG